MLASSAFVGRVSSVRLTNAIRAAQPAPFAPEAPHRRTRRAMSASRAQAGAVETGAQATGAAAAGAPVVVFTTPGCPYCKRAKDALRGRGVQYSEVDVSKDTALRAALGDATGQKTVPQVRRALRSERQRRGGANAFITGRAAARGILPPAPRTHAPPNARTALCPSTPRSRTRLPSARL